MWETIGLVHGYTLRRYVDMLRYVHGEMVLSRGVESRWRDGSQEAGFEIGSKTQRLEQKSFIPNPHNRATVRLYDHPTIQPGDCTTVQLGKC